MSTIHKVLRHRGFITPQPHKRPRSSYIGFQAEQPNECWQADITHWQLADPNTTAPGAPIEILDIIDDHSRKALTCTAQPVFTALAVRDCFRDAFSTHEPARLRTHRQRRGLHRRPHRHWPPLGHVANLNIRIIATANGQLIRELTLDTSRDYEPQQRKTPPANS